MTDFSLMDIMGNFTGGPAVPDDTPNYDTPNYDTPNYGTVSTATTQAVATPQIKSYVTPNVAPNQGTTYDRMLQAESGNRDYDAQGRPITSPKGAMFASQVMPATAAAPGYGVKPAQAQTPEEYNRVGREYFQAMLNKFGGNEQAAIAAYNAGPGKVQQNIGQNNGQMNVAQLPKETQGFLGKVQTGLGNVVNNMIPSAQASTLPPQPGVPLDTTGLNAPKLQTGTGPTQIPSGGISPEQAAQQAQQQPAPQPFTGQGLSIGGQTQQQLQQQQQQTAILNSNNQQDISKLAFDPNTPKDTQMAALDKLHNTMAYNESMRRAQQKMSELGANANSRELSKAMNDPSIGDYFKVVLYQALGWREKSAELLDRLDPKIVYGTSTFGDKNVVTKVNANTGEVVGAVVDGNWTSDPKILNEVMAQGGVSVPGTAKSFLMPQTAGSPVTKTIDGQLVNGIQIYDPVSKKFYVQYGNQRDNNPQGWTSATQNADQQAILAKQKAVIELQQTWSKLDMEGRAKAIEATNAALVKQLGPNAQLLTITDVGGQLPTALPQGGAQPAPANAPVAGGAPQAAAVPQGGARTIPVAPNTPAATGQVPATTPQGALKMPTLAEIQAEEARKKQQLEIETDQAKDRNKANQQYSDELAKSRQSASAQNSTINRLQTSIDKNPEFWGIDTNSPAWRAFVDLNSTNENKAEALNTLARNLNIAPSKRTQFDQTMNDYRNLQVNAITGSGLSASQTNTEKESQRVLGTVGSISDRPAAAKATLEYAKAKIEYTDAKARAWTEARKANPNIDRLEFETNFDATQGEKIFENANKRMTDIISGVPSVGTVKNGYRFKGGNPADKNNWEKV
jgi:soluble lytic murein transglycosylase